MPKSVFVTAANNYGYAIGTTVTASDAQLLDGQNWCVLSSTRPAKQLGALDVEFLKNVPSLVTAINIAHAFSNTQFNCQGLTAGQNVQLDSVVIPAGAVGANALIEIYAMYSFPGGAQNAKDPLIRIGPTAGTFATAQNILNNQGFSSQLAFIADIRGHNRGSVASNIWTPPQGSGWGNQGPNAPVNYAVDFSQSVTIYFGGTCNNGAGMPTDIVRLETYSVTVTQ